MPPPVILNAVGKGKGAFIVADEGNETHPSEFLALIVYNPVDKLEKTPEVLMKLELFILKLNPEMLELILIEPVVVEQVGCVTDKLGEAGVVLIVKCKVTTESHPLTFVNVCVGSSEEV